MADITHKTAVIYGSGTNSGRPLGLFWSITMTMFIRSYTLGDFLDSAYLGSGAEIFGLQDFRFPDPAPIPEFFSIAGGESASEQHGDIDGT